MTHDPARCATPTCKQPACCTAPDGLPCCAYCAAEWAADGHVMVGHRPADELHRQQVSGKMAVDNGAES